MLFKFTPRIEHLKCVVLTPKEGLNLTRTMIKILPGTNEVTDDEWKAMRGNITNELDSGEITILAQKVSAGRGKVGGIKAKDLKQMPVNLAVKYVSECTNADTLTKWYEEITNEEVRLAIVKRFKKLGLELPEDKIPDTPNEAPMSLDEFEDDEDYEEEFEDSENEDDVDEEMETSEDDDTSEDFSGMKISELKEECEKRGIDTEGKKKSDLIDALNNSEQE